MRRITDFALRYASDRLPHPKPGTSKAEVGSISRATGLFVDNINEDPDSVALMADITSSVNIGDVIVAHLSPESPEPYIVELKDGAVNDRIVSLVEEFGAESEGLPAEVLQEIDTEIGRHGRRHFERVARQVRRARNFESIANHDVGNDPETGAPMQNIGPELTISTYDAELEAMMFAAAKNGSAFGCIDDCLWVGVYYSVPKHGTLLNQSQGGNYILERWQRHGRCKHQCVGSGL